jgi:hypothetical protein
MTPALPDPLLRLTLEALTQLTNVGLVKRAQREVEAGTLPTLARADDGSLQAEFKDGVRTVFAPGAGIADARCSCGAALCRHRLIVVLAWQRQATDSAPAAQTLRSPGAIDDAALKTWTGPTAWAQAERLRSSGLLIDVRRASAIDPVATALLPQATVRFHGGDDPGAAQSDAAVSDHRACVVIGVWAFRAADSESPDAPQVRVQLGSRVIAASGVDTPLARLIAGLIQHGLADGGARHAPALTDALDTAGRLGATWLQLALQALEAWLAAFDARSARFHVAEGLALLAELGARTRAARGNGEVAAQHALGVGERLETPLARVRLRALGLRIEADGEQRMARVALHDPDTSARIAWGCRWDNAGATGAASVTRGQQARVSNSGRLAELAHGQLVTVSARRRADGELRLGSGHGGRTSLLGQSADWSELPSALVVTRLADWRAARAHLPPALLRPRHALAEHIVFAPTTISEVGFDPATQSVHALLTDADDECILLTRSWESAAAGALDALARALTASAPVRHVSGVLRETGSLPELDPWALSDGTQLSIPDLAMPDGALRNLPIGAVPAVGDLLTQALARTEDWLAGRLLAGPGAPAWRARGRELATQLQRVGWSDLAEGVQALAEAVDDPTRRDDAALAEPAIDLLLRLQMTREVLAAEPL